MLLSETLSQACLSTGTLDERNQQGKDLAVKIVPHTDVERWRKKGYTVKRGCYAADGACHVLVQITGPKVYKTIELTHSSSGITGRVGTEDLNGSTPATSHELVELINSIAK